MTQPVSPEDELKACTCHPDDRPPECQHRYVASVCIGAWATRTVPPKTVLDEIESALFDPIESDAVLNLESVVYDLEHGFKVDDGGVCVRSIKRVMAQLEIVRNLLTRLKDRS